MHPSDWKVQASQCRLTSSDDICSSQLCQFWHLRVFSSFPDWSSSRQQFGYGLGWGEGVFLLCCGFEISQKVCMLMVFA